MAIRETMPGETLLAIIGPQSTHNDKYFRYNTFSVEGLPQDGDPSAFAHLYRKLETLQEKLGGRNKENSPTAFGIFEYLYGLSPANVLTILEEMGVSIKVRKILHNGNDVQVQQTIQDLSRWIDGHTEFDPNPGEDDPQSLEKQRQAQIEEGNNLWDQKFGSFVLLPIVLVSFGASLVLAFSYSWAMGNGLVLLSIFLLWWIYR